MAWQLARCVGRRLSSRPGCITSYESLRSLPSRCQTLNVGFRSFSRLSGHRAPSSYMPTPFITETIGGMTHTTDLWSRLLKERIILLNSAVDDQGAATIV